MSFGVKMEFGKYGKIKQLGHEDNKNLFIYDKQKVYIQEKIDGGNFRFYITSEGALIFGSRTQQLTSNEGEDTNVSKNFKRCVLHIREQYKSHKEAFLMNHIYYGECCTKHTMDYDWEKIPSFLGFDIRSMETGKYLTCEESMTMFDLCGLKCVPLLKVIYAEDFKGFTDEDVPITAYPPRSNPKQQAEGVVFKNYEYEDKYNTHMFAKYVREKFKEENRETFGGAVKFQENDDGKIVARFCTNARIEKQIFKLIDDDHELDMTLMKYLPRGVSMDIYEEHWKDILNSNMKIDLKNIRRLISKRCLMVLKQVLVNNTLQ